MGTINMLFEEQFTVRNETEMKVIRFDLLIAITVDNYLCTFYIDGEDNFTCTKKLNKVENILPNYFVKIKRDTIINTRKIKSFNIKERKISLYGGHILKYAAKNPKITNKIREFCVSI